MNIAMPKRKSHSGLNKILNGKEKKDIEFLVQSNAQLNFTVLKTEIDQFEFEVNEYLKLNSIVPLGKEKNYHKPSMMIGDKDYISKEKVRITYYLLVKDRHPITLEKLDVE